MTRTHDSAAFALLYEREYNNVLGWLILRSHNRADAEDLAQETFLRAWRTYGNFTDRGFGVRPWLLRIAANLWKNEVRRRSADKRDGAEVPLDALGADAVPAAATVGSLARGAPNPLDDALAAERVRVVRRLVRQLPPQMRRCVLLRVGQEQKYRDIASVMQLSIDTVKSQLAQARQRLKSGLDRHLDAGGAE